MDFPSITGIPNRKYDLNFIGWLFTSLNDNHIRAMVQLGLDNGYLTSLLLARMAFTDFNYLGVGSDKEIPEVMAQDDTGIFCFTDRINNVETVSRVAMFVIGNGPLFMLCEDAAGPLFYYPLLKPGDVLVTNGVANISANPNSIYSNYNWKYYVK